MENSIWTLDHQYKDLRKRLSQEALDSWEGKTGKERAERLDAFLDLMLEEYSQAFSMTKEDLLIKLDAKRDYSAINYYQESKFPKLKDVRIFETQDDLLASIPSRKFRCPRCKGESGSPYTCDTGIMVQGKPKETIPCDWKSWGFFMPSTAVVVKNMFFEFPKIERIFEPLEWEAERLKKEGVK